MHNVAMPVSFENVGHWQRFARRLNLNEPTYDWLVEIQSIQHPETIDIVVVPGRVPMEAVSNAFFTRNIASSWQVISLERE